VFSRDCRGIAAPPSFDIDCVGAITDGAKRLPGSTGASARLTISNTA
jgi:hypothetical protein